MLLLGCTSLSDSPFILQKLDDQNKSRALTEAGVEQYEIHVVHQAEYDKIPEIRNYFIVALRYDPANSRAQQYLTIVEGVDDYKNAQLKQNLGAASRGLQKPKRNDDENCAIFVSLQTAVKIYPRNAEARKMLNDTASLRSALVASYLAKAETATSKIDDKTPDVVKEKQYTEAFQQAERAVAIEPGSLEAKNARDAARSALGTLVARRVDLARKAIAAGNFSGARTQVSALNRHVNDNFETEVRQATYSLNYKWAVSLYNRKDYTTADVKNEAALAALTTDEARALRRKIADRRAKELTMVSFSVSLQDIDSLIASGELVAAHRKVNSLAKVAKEPGAMQQLDSRNDKIISSLKDLYDKGAEAYRTEDFKATIELLQTVVAIQVDFEQASDYLDKARSKQKLLDQY